MPLIQPKKISQETEERLRKQYTTDAPKFHSKREALEFLLESGVLQNLTPDERVAVENELFRLWHELSYGVSAVCRKSYEGGLSCEEKKTQSAESVSPRKD